MDTDVRDLAVPALVETVKMRLPLVPRAKPVCRSLDERVARVRHLADLARQPSNESLTRAAEAHNLAALIASDCGIPALARSLCWRQFDAFNGAGPFDAATAKLTLQPLINLGRLLIRDGNGAAAYQLLETLFNAVKRQTESVIDGRTVSFKELVADPRDHHEIVRWLWSVLLADGTRALTRAGRWREALQHAQQHKGIGERLFDGRQVAIIAHCAASAHDHAHKALATTTAETPWEQAVAACLKVVCLEWSGWNADSAITRMVDQYLVFRPGSEHAVFHVRLGLLVLDLVNTGHGLGQVTPVVERSAVEAADAYAAHEVLSSPRVLPLTADGSRALVDIVRVSGLGQGTMPEVLRNDLVASTRASEESIKGALAGNP